jgi:hypothetical protein
VPAVANAYPELPVVPYQPTHVAMTFVIAQLSQMAIAVEVRRAAYVLFRIEGGNGHSGINNNYVGAQADGARWPKELDQLFAATVVLKENSTGRLRRFVAFADVAGCLTFLCNRVKARGLYVGGTTDAVTRMAVATPTDLCRAYTREWVTGNASAEPTAQALADFLSMFSQAQQFFV